MQTTNIVDENIKKIGKMFPNCLTEAKDDYGRLMSNGFKGCPYYRDGDEYKVVRHQI